MESIEVKVTKYAERRFVVMYYDCPLSGKRITRSTKQEKMKEAEKVAAKWEAELREGRYRPLANITWAEFRDRYEQEAVASMAENTGDLIAPFFNAIERILNPEKLRTLTEERLSYFQSQLREAKLAEASIKTYLAHLRAALTWAAEMNLLAAVPTIKIPRRAKGSKLMKGRPIVGEEFDRMRDKVEVGLLAVTRDGYKPRKDRKKVRSEAVNQKRNARQWDEVRAAGPYWRRLLRGLLLSGLRLGEALNLSWDEESKILVDMSGDRPMMRIRAELEKGGQDRIHPITRDFAEFLAETPVDRRSGPVFPIAVRGEFKALTTEWASKVISAIGEAAGVIVDRDKGKFASAHDLRRTFGAKWAKLVMPAVLQQLMRHESVETSMRYYAALAAQDVADVAWKAGESLVSSRVGQNQPETAEAR